MSQQTEYYVQDSEDEEHVYLQEIQSRIDKIENQQRKINIIIQKLMTFYCERTDLSNDACMRMFG